MNLLLDTHILLWALSDDEKLSDKARKMILAPENTVYYSVVSIWEISIKHAIHPDNVVFSGKEIMQYCRDAGYLALDLQERHIASLETLKRKETAKPHHDPFDRMLIAQAKSERMTFVTHDSLLPDYQEKCIYLV